MDSITRENTPTRNDRKWKLERHIIEASMTFTLNFATNLTWWKFLRKLANHNQCGISWIESPHQVNGLCISWFFQFFVSFYRYFDGVSHSWCKHLQQTQLLRFCVGPNTLGSLSSLLTSIKVFPTLPWAEITIATFLAFYFVGVDDLERHYKTQPWFKVLCCVCKLYDIRIDLNWNDVSTTVAVLPAARSITSGRTWSLFFSGNHNSTGNFQMIWTIYVVWWWLHLS